MALEHSGKMDKGIVTSPFSNQATDKVMFSLELLDIYIFNLLNS